MTSTSGTQDFVAAMQGTTLLAYPTGATLASGTIAARSTDELRLVTEPTERQSSAHETAVRAKYEQAQ